MPRDWLEEVIDAIPVGKYHPSFRGEGKTSITVRVSEGMMTEMELAIRAAGNNGLPIKSVSDFVRDSVGYFLRALQEYGSIDGDQLASLSAAREWAEENQWLGSIAETARENVKNLTITLQKLIVSSETKIAKQRLRKFHDMVRHQSDPYVRKCYDDAMVSNPDYHRILNTLSPNGEDPLAEDSDRRSNPEPSESDRREGASPTRSVLVDFPTATRRRDPEGTAP